MMSEGMLKYVAETEKRLQMAPLLVMAAPGIRPPVWMIGILTWMRRSTSLARPVESMVAWTPLILRGVEPDNAWMDTLLGRYIELRRSDSFCVFGGIL